MNQKRVLIVDDEDGIRKLMESRLTREGYSCDTAESPQEARMKIERSGPYGVIVSDIKMPSGDGYTVLKSAKSTHSATRVILITGHGDKQHAVRALKDGANNYLEKPFDMDELAHAVTECSKAYALSEENAELISRLEARVERTEGKAEDATWYVSKSKSMAKVNDWLAILRRESFRGEAEEPTVLILGESGTGKEGIARMIHAGSRRGRGPWVALNCANLSEQLLESELFGHEKGSFTGATTQKRGLFEVARGGTLFLDEIGEMDIKLQAKLLRVIQEKTFRRVGGTADLSSDVRVVAATHRNLAQSTQTGAFREDLYHRIAKVVLEIPSLRERSEDILPMATQFCERAFSARGKTFEGFTPEAEASLHAYAWPGNVRELLNLVERAALVSSMKSKVSPGALMIPDATKVIPMPGVKLELMKNPLGAGATPEGSEGYMSLKKRWSDSFEREYLMGALQRHRGNVSSAAREAQLDRSNFLRLLRRHGIKATEIRAASKGATVHKIAQAA